MINKILSILLLIIICFTNGCILIKKPIEEIPENLYENYDLNSLKDTDRTFQLNGVTDITVIIDDEEKLVRFTDDWYIIHKDWIKTFNENQNRLIELLSKKKLNN